MDKKSMKAFLNCIPPGVACGRSDPTETFRRVQMRSPDGGMFYLGVPSSPVHRGEGRTLLQLMEAPQGATYVWPIARSVRYAIDLAWALRREDLRIIHMQQMARPEFAFKTTSKVVVDHACWDVRWGYDFSASMSRLRARGLVEPHGD